MVDKIVTYDEMKKFENKPDVLIIDVREPDEIEKSGRIGGSINIPMGQLENALKRLNEDEFKKLYKIQKPKDNFPLVFSCKMGGRAEKAMDVALKSGYKNARFYKGSWDEWEKMKKK